MPVAERSPGRPSSRRDLPGRPRPARGRVHRGVRVVAVARSRGAAERHHERQARLGQLGAEPVLIPVGAVRGQARNANPASRARTRGRRRWPAWSGTPDRSCPSRSASPACTAPRAPGTDALTGPHRGHGDHAVAGLAVPARPLPSHVRGPGPVLAVAAVIDHQHPAAMRPRRRIGPAASSSRGNSPGQRPTAIRTRRTAAAAPPHAAHPSPARPRPAPSASCSGPAAPAAPPGTPGTPPLRHPGKQAIKPRRVLLQRARRRRARPTCRHHAPQTVPGHQDEDVAVIEMRMCGACHGPAGWCWRGRGVRAGVVVVSLS